MGSQGQSAVMQTRASAQWHDAVSAARDRVLDRISAQLERDDDTEEYL